MQIISEHCSYIELVSLPYLPFLGCFHIVEKYKELVSIAAAEPAVENTSQSHLQIRYASSFSCSKLSYSTTLSE